MSIAQPQLLFACNEASGRTVTNYGSVATNATIPANSGPNVENTDWAWVPNADPKLGYLSYITSAVGPNNKLVSLDATGIALPTTLNSLWGAAKFRLTGRDTVTNVSGLYAQPQGGSTAGGMSLVIGSPTSANDFDLQCRIVSNSGVTAGPITFTNLLYNTDYAVSLYADVTTVSAVVLKALLDLGSVQTSASANFTSESWFSTGGWAGRGFDFTNYRGIAGRLYYLMEGRNVTPLVDADLTAINTDPANVTGWPSAAAGGSFVPLLPQRNRRHTGRYS